MKKILILLLLAVIGGGALYLTQESNYTDRGGVPDEISALQSIDPALVSEIRISRGESRVTLTRDGDRWVLPESWNYPAQQKKAEDFLSAFRAIRDPEHRGENASKHSSFEVDAETGAQVELSGNGAGLPARVVIGKFDGAGRCFVRPAAGNAVYSVRSDLRAAANFGETLSAREWLDTEFFAPPLGVDLVKLVLLSDGTEVELVKDEPAPPDPNAEDQDAEPEDVWRVTRPESFVANPETVSALITRISRPQRAHDAADPTQRASYGLDAPERQVTLHYADGSSITLRFGVEEQGEPDPNAGEDTPQVTQTGRFYAQCDGDERVFTVQKWTRDGFFRSLDELRPVPEAPPEGEAVGPELPGGADTTTQPGD